MRIHIIIAKELSSLIYDRMYGLIEKEENLQYVSHEEKTYWKIPSMREIFFEVDIKKPRSEKEWIGLFDCCLKHNDIRRGDDYLEICHYSEFGNRNDPFVIVYIPAESVIMPRIKIGDFVTAYGSGYWQLIDIKPKIATEDYTGEDVCWKKGQVLGQWAILKKCFTAKMKPRIDFSYEDFTLISPVSGEILSEMEKYFEEHPKYRQKFENAEIKLRKTITNCYLDLPEEKEEAFRTVLGHLPERYSMADVWKTIGDYKQYISKPPVKYLLNFFAYPWDIDGNGDLIYTDCELVRI